MSIGKRLAAEIHGVARGPIRGPNKFRGGGIKAVPDAAIDMSLPAPNTARVAANAGAAAPRARRGPVLPMQRWLIDAKTVFGGGDKYQCARARTEQSGAVAERAHAVGNEYLNAARLADAQYSTAGTTPILDRLQSFGQTR